MIELRLKKWNCSMHSQPVYKYKIEYRRGNRGRWHTYMSFGKVMLFELTARDQAVEYMRQIRYPGIMKTSDMIRIQQSKTIQA